MGCLGAVEENALQDAPQERASISISEGGLGTQCNQCSSTERVERETPVPPTLPATYKGLYSSSLPVLDLSKRHKAASGGRLLRLDTIRQRAL